MLFDPGQRRALAVLRLPPLVARVTQILNAAAVAATTHRLRSELAYLAYTDAFGRRWDLAGSVARFPARPPRPGIRK